MTSPKDRAVVRTDRAPAAIGPYSQAMRSGDLVFTAGQIALDPSNGKIVGGDVRAQTRQVLRNLAAVLEAAGCTWSDVLKTTIFLRDMADFAAVNEEYALVVGDAPPARSTVAVAGLPLDARVEIDVIARQP
jgi:2-iminobutanoate/2-iminopropanoate deaminase